jgi:hypothetical protein
VIEFPAMIGRTLGALPPGPLFRFDPRATLDIEISAGALSAIGDEAALAGGNLFALQGDDGRFEIFSAALAELIGERTFRLSRLLRGLAGSEPEAARTVAAGATIVRLDEAVTSLTSDVSDLGRTWRYRVGPAGRDHADPAMVELSATVGPEALKPFSPIRVSARREAEGIRLSFIRRTRRDGDAWEPLDVPLGEDAERYEVTVLVGGTPRRVLAASEPSVLYPAAAELTDFGAPQTALDVSVVQWSAVVGRGFERVVTVPVS